MQLTLKGGKGIPVNNQIWYWKELGTFIAMIGMILLLFPLGQLLLQANFFKELNETPAEQKAATGFGWWVGAVLTVLVPLPLFIWAIGYSAPGKLTASALFPQNNTTVIMYWAVAVALVSLILFLLWHFIFNRRKGASFVNYGLTWKDKGLDWVKIGKSFVLAAIICFAAYLTLAFSAWAFTTDYRLWVFAIKPMSLLHFRIFLMYFVPVLIYFLVIGLILHGELRRGKAGSEVKLWKETLINIFLLITGFIILEALQYGPLFAGGTLAIPAASLWSIIMFQLFPIFTIVALVSTYFYRKTGHIYTGAFLNTMLVTWIIVAGQATHFAF
jgi:hypothetical protein